MTERKKPTTPRPLELCGPFDKAAWTTRDKRVLSDVQGKGTGRGERGNVGEGDWEGGGVELDFTAICPGWEPVCSFQFQDSASLPLRRHGIGEGSRGHL